MREVSEELRGMVARMEAAHSQQLQAIVAAVERLAAQVAGGQANQPAGSEESCTTTTINMQKASLT